MAGEVGHLTPGSINKSGVVLTLTYALSAYYAGKAAARLRSEVVPPLKIGIDEHQRLRRV